MQIYARKLLLPHGFENDQVVEIEEGKIVSISPGVSGDLCAEILTSGLIDLHVHGGEGFNMRDFGIDQIEPFLTKMLESGVTDFLMTISTGRRELMREALEATRQAMALQKDGKLGGARILGAHLEGPFLSKMRPGAMQVSAIVPPSVETYEHMFSGYEDVIRLISLAPEEDGADELIPHLLSKGIAVQAGHTYATCEQARHGFALGIQSLCHTFNACRDIHHREPGVVTAALLDDRIYCEAICDLAHLHPATLQLIYRMKGPKRMILISDSVATHGMPDGDYFMEGYHIVVHNGVSRTAEGALDGGGAYLDGAVRNLISLGISQADAVIMASATPAERMGLENIGSIRTGTLAHLTAWNNNWEVAFTVMGG